MGLARLFGTPKWARYVHVRHYFNQTLNSRAAFQAGSAYARSVQTLHPLPANQLPSPELLFDTLLKREKQVDHPAGLSSFFFAFANCKHKPHSALSDLPAFTHILLI